MSNRFGKLKLLTLKSTEEEFDEAFVDYIDNRIDIAYERAKLLYQIKEFKKQNATNRKLVFATWIMAIATWALVIITFFSSNL